MIRKNDIPFTGAALALHALLLLGAWVSLPQGQELPKSIILAVETVPGAGTPLGMGSGAKGDAKVITDKLASPQPIASSLKLDSSDLPEKKSVPKAKQAKIKIRPAPSAADLEKEHSALP